MTNFKETKEAIMFANEYIVGSAVFDTVTLTACPLDSGSYHSIHQSVDINEYLYHWSHASLIRTSRTTKHQPNLTRLLYLFGDFGAGKSSVCTSLIKRLYDEYELSRYSDTLAEPILPIYLDLRVLTGIYDSVEFANKNLAQLIEVMFCVTGIPPIDGNDIIKLVRQYPCVVVFDGFDEAVQKMGKNQQNGFLNKLLSLLPTAQYNRDLMRIVGQSVEESTIPDTRSKIMISCRSQLFESQQELTTFTEAFYSTELSINGIHNYQAYRLDTLDTPSITQEFNAYFRRIREQQKQQQLALAKEQQEEQYFERYLNNQLSAEDIERDEYVDNDIDHDDDNLADLELKQPPPSDSVCDNINDTHHDSMLDLDNEDVKSFLQYLINLSSNPLLLSLSKSLLPHIQHSIDTTGSINSAQMFTDVITKLMQRDSRKSVINIKEKQKILGALALQLWQQKTRSISLESLRSFFFDNYQYHRQLQTGIDTGRIEIETAFQDLHSSMIVRDDYDMYGFCQPLIFDYFLAVGVFEAVLNPQQQTLEQIAECAVHAEIEVDSLIFVSHMALSLIMRRDSISYDRFYAHWSRVCQSMITLTTEDPTKAHDMWEVVTGEMWVG